jgi:hypothetical protein
VGCLSSIPDATLAACPGHGTSGSRYRKNETLELLAGSVRARPRRIEGLEGHRHAAKSRPSDSGEVVISPTYRSAQDRQSTQLVLFGRRCEPLTWPVLGRNYREGSAGNGWMGAAGRR